MANTNPMKFVPQASLGNIAKTGVSDMYNTAKTGLSTSLGKVNESMKKDPQSWAMILAQIGNAFAPEGPEGNVGRGLSNLGYQLGRTKAGEVYKDTGKVSLGMTAEDVARLDAQGREDSKIDIAKRGATTAEKNATTNATSVTNQGNHFIKQGEYIDAQIKAMREKLSDVDRKKIDLAGDNIQGVLAFMAEGGGKIGKEHLDIIRDKIDRWNIAAEEYGFEPYHLAIVDEGHWWDRTPTYRLVSGPRPQGNADAGSVTGAATNVDGKAGITGGWEEEKEALTPKILNALKGDTKQDSSLEKSGILGGKGVEFIMDFLRGIGEASEKSRERYKEGIARSLAGNN